MNFTEYLLFLLVSLNGLVFFGQMTSYMASNINPGNYKVSRLKLMENKIFPHTLFYTATSFLVLLMINIYIHQTFIRAVLFLPFIALAVSLGVNFQNKYNADSFS